MNVPHRAAARRLPHETLDALLQRLAASRDGLRSEDALRRLRSGGPNEFKTTQLRSEVVELIRGSANPLVIILLIAGIASASLGEVSDAVIIGGIVLLSGGINAWQTFRSQQAVRLSATRSHRQRPYAATAHGRSVRAGRSWWAM